MYKRYCVEKPGLVKLNIDECFFVTGHYSTDKHSSREFLTALDLSSQTRQWLKYVCLSLKL